MVQRLVSLIVAIKLGSCYKHPAYCQDRNVDVWHMRNGRNVMVCFKCDGSLHNVQIVQAKQGRNLVGSIIFQAWKLNFFPRSNSAPRSKILGVNLV